MKVKIKILTIISIALLTLTGCPELGQIGGPGDYGSVGSDLNGEIRHVDSRNREIELRTDAGRTWKVRYDNRTRVTYRQREYAVANLESGDYVAMRTLQERDGRYYTDLVTVRESVQDRRRAGRLDFLEGRVEYVDSRRGVFEMRDRNNRLVVVSVPYNAPRWVSDRFNRLRQGDYVRIEGRFVNQDRFDMENFV